MSLGRGTHIHHRRHHDRMHSSSSSSSVTPTNAHSRCCKRRRPSFSTTTMILGSRSCSSSTDAAAAALDRTVRLVDSPLIASYASRRRPRSSSPTVVMSGNNSATVRRSSPTATNSDRSSRSAPRGHRGPPSTLLLQLLASTLLLLALPAPTHAKKVKPGPGTEAAAASAAAAAANPEPISEDESTLTTTVSSTIDTPSDDGSGATLDLLELLDVKHEAAPTVPPSAAPIIAPSAAPVVVDSNDDDEQDTRAKTNRTDTNEDFVYTTDTSTGLATLPLQPFSLIMFNSFDDISKASLTPESINLVVETTESYLEGGLGEIYGEDGYSFGNVKLWLERRESVLRRHGDGDGDDGGGPVRRLTAQNEGAADGRAGRSLRRPAEAEADSTSNHRRTQYTIGTSLTLGGEVTFLEFPTPQPWKVASDFLGLVRQEDALKDLLVATGDPALIGLEALQVKGGVPTGTATDAISAPSDGVDVEDVKPPTAAPTASPTDTPVAEPTGAPVEAPTPGASSPTAAPVSPPTSASPVTSPVSPPTASPVAPPTEAPPVEDGGDGDDDEDVGSDGGGGGQDPTDDGSAGNGASSPAPAPSPQRTPTIDVSDFVNEPTNAGISGGGGGGPTATLTGGDADAAIANAEPRGTNESNNSTVIAVLSVLLGLAVVIGSVLLVRRRRRQKAQREDKFWSVSRVVVTEEQSTVVAGNGGCRHAAYEVVVSPPGTNGSSNGGGGAGISKDAENGAVEEVNTMLTYEEESPDSTKSSSGTGSGLMMGGGSSSDRSLPPAATAGARNKCGTPRPQALPPPPTTPPLSKRDLEAGRRPSTSSSSAGAHPPSVSSSRGAVYAANSYRSQSSFRSHSSGGTAALAEATGFDSTLAMAAGSGSSRPSNVKRSPEAIAAAASAALVGAGEVVANLFRRGSSPPTKGQNEDERVGRGAGGGSRAGAVVKMTSLASGVTAPVDLDVSIEAEDGADPDGKTPIKRNNSDKSWDRRPSAEGGGGGVVAKALALATGSAYANKGGASAAAAAAASSSPRSSKISKDEFHQEWDQNLPYEWDPVNGTGGASEDDPNGHVRRPPPHHTVPTGSAGAFPSVMRCGSHRSGGDTSSYQTSNAGETATGGGFPHHHPGDASYLHPLDWSNRGSDTELDGETGSVGNSTLSDHQSEGRLGRVAIVPDHHPHEEEPSYPAIPATLLDGAGVVGGGGGLGPTTSPAYSGRSDGVVGAGGGAGGGGLIMSPQSAVPSHDPTSPSSQSGLTTAQSSDVGGRSPGDAVDGPTQFINDLLWLEKKIADVRGSAKGGGGNGEDGGGGGGNGIGRGYPHSPGAAAAGEMLSPTSRHGGGSGSSNPYGRYGNGGGVHHQKMRSIVCRDTYAPPGKLHVVLHTTDDGPTVHSIREGSALEGHLFAGDLIVAVDDADTRNSTAEDVIKMLGRKVDRERKITVLHFEDEE